MLTSEFLDKHKGDMKEIKSKVRSEFYKKKNLQEPQPEKLSIL